MNINEWGVIEWSTIIGIVITIVGSALASYISVIKNSTATRSDINNGFEKLREIEQVTAKEITNLKARLETKAVRISSVERMLLEYIKKHEADSIYCKKETMQPTIDILKQNQENLHSDLKDFRSDFKKSISDIVNGLNGHIENDRDFQQQLILELRKGN